MAHTCAKHSILLLQLFIAAHEINHLGGGAALQLGSEVANLALERVDVVLCPLADGSLCFSVVCALPLQLSGSEGGDAPGSSS
jgi:hypothetical protein